MQEKAVTVLKSKKKSIKKSGGAQVNIFRKTETEFQQEGERFSYTTVRIYNGLKLNRFWA